MNVRGFQQREGCARRTLQEGEAGYFLLVQGNIYVEEIDYQALRYGRVFYVLEQVGLEHV